MDPYLEHHALWLAVHNRLVTAIADTLAPLLAPRYYIGMESRMVPLPLADVDVLEVELPIAETVHEA
jgi:hypothetical protein